MFFNPIFMIFGVVFGIISLFAVLIGLLVLSIILWLRKLFSPFKIGHNPEIQNDNNHNENQNEENINSDEDINSNQEIILEEEKKEPPNEGQAENQNEWSICTEPLDLNHGDLATVLWGHVFHMNCIEDWIGNNQHNFCPKDRSRILRHEIKRLMF